MSWFIAIAGIFAGGMAYKLSAPWRYVKIQNLEGHHSRLSNNPISPDVHKAAGVDLIRSGHPDENIFRAANRKSMSLMDIRVQTANDLQKNRSVISSNHFNDQISQRKTYPHVNADVGFPQVNMATGWYAKTLDVIRKNRPDYIKTF
jgi:hypothetical protein